MPTENLTLLHEPRLLRGAVDAATAFLDDGLTAIAGMHRAIARKPFAALGLAPGVSDVSKGVQVLHDGITSLVYGGIRAGLKATGVAARIAVDLADRGREEPKPGSTGDMAIAALNGFAGDRLARSGNPLSASMHLRQGGKRVAVERGRLAAAFPNSSPRVAVFVHGLACSEHMWSVHSERHYGAPGRTYGSRLEADLGYTPLYVRYNSGLHISENGRMLAQLLRRLVAEWPTRIDEIVLIGHSMGGLVLRSACHYGREGALDWIDLVRHVVFLGSPHLGAPLEKAANVAAWCLGLTDITRPLGIAINRRSAGIKDLRFGALRDDDWKTIDLDAPLSGLAGDVPLLPSASHYFVAATVTRSARHPLGIAVGDLLVREQSASGGRLRHSRFPLGIGRHFGAMNHFELLNHPDLYEQMHRWFIARRVREPDSFSS